MKQVIASPYHAERITLDDAIAQSLSWLRFEHKPVTTIAFRKSATLMTDDYVVRIYPVNK